MVVSYILFYKDSSLLKYDTMNYSVIQPNTKTCPIERVYGAQKHESSIGSKDLDPTPTGAVACVCSCLCLHCFHLDILNSGEKPSQSGNGGL